ncbi:MAG: hypothetical protein ISP89_09510 [Pseudomonadales bacterium]|nr:hypothetical protein [Pseudomonadales bacterium]
MGLVSKPSIGYQRQCREKGKTGLIKVSVRASLAAGLSAVFITLYMLPPIFAQEVVRLVPALKSEPLSASNARNPNVERASLGDLNTAIGRYAIVPLSAVASMARIVAIGDGFTIASQDDLVLVAGELKSAAESYSIYRPGRIQTRIIDSANESKPDSQVNSNRNSNKKSDKKSDKKSEKRNEIKSQIQELVYSGKADLVVETYRNATGASKAWFRLTKSVGVIRIGDVIVPEGTLSEHPLLSLVSEDSKAAWKQRPNYSVPANAPKGKVLSFFSEQQWGAKYSTLVLNRGAAEGLTHGMRITLAPPTQRGEEGEEVFAEETAEAIIYSHTPYFSLAFVVSASQPIERGSRIILPVRPRNEL